jgi:integrase
MTVAELCDEYVADMQSGKVAGKKASTVKSDISRIASRIKPILGKRKVTAITQSDVEDFMLGMNPRSARRVTGLLGAIFSYGVKRKIMAMNPVHGVDKPADVKRMRRLSEAEYRALWTALQAEKSVANEVILFLTLTGWRSSEGKNLKFSEVDLERRTGILGDTKSGVSIRPLSSAAVEIIRRQKRREGQEFVFEHRHALPISNLTPWWNKLALDKTVTPHVLRHSHASLASDMGIADHLISGLLGHKRQGITSRYQHLSDRALIETADRVANETLRLMCAS